MQPSQVPGCSFICLPLVASKALKLSSISLVAEFLFVLGWLLLFVSCWFLGGIMLGASMFIQWMRRLRFVEATVFTSEVLKSNDRHPKLAGPRHKMLPCWRSWPVEELVRIKLFLLRPHVKQHHESFSKLYSLSTWLEKTMFWKRNIDEFTYLVSQPRCEDQTPIQQRRTPSMAEALPSNLAGSTRS